jgi:hypothetical protein
MSILLAAMMVTLGPAKAQAQITAPGPYYAVPAWDQTLPTAMARTRVGTTLCARRPAGRLSPSPFPV